jgi:hypothetical protein
MTYSARIAALPFGLSTAIADAGPCSDEIQRIETAVNQPNSYTPTLPQTIGAQICVAADGLGGARRKACAREPQSRARPGMRNGPSQQSGIQKVVEELKNLVGLQ